MNSKIEKMTLPKLVELKSCVWDLIESYTNELMTYGFMNNEDYIRTMATPREKEILSKRMKARQLYDDILKLIESKIEEYYD
jgi:uncharacterized sporulation protein YeaH/YhbH (DUF444 family)